MSAALSAKARERLEAKLDRSLPDFITRTIEQGDLRALLADSDSLAAAEQKADSYDLTHTGDWFERAHALGQRNPGRYAGRDIWHVAVEMAEALPIAERERDEAQRAKYGTPCKCESWIAACGMAEDEAANLRAQVEVLRVVLAECEWASAPNRSEGLCPVCGGREPLGGDVVGTMGFGHNDDCALATALRATAPEPREDGGSDE